MTNKIFWDIYPGLMIMYPQQLIAAPVGTIMVYSDYSNTVQYIRTFDGWLDQTGSEGVIPNKDITAKYCYFRLDGRNTIVSLPDTEEPEVEETSRGSVLLEARTLITGDRNVTYGSPVQNFKNIGEMWTTRLKHKLKDGETISGSDVADMMVLVKVARNIAQPKRDNYTDGAGYFACGYENLVAEQDEN